MTEPKNEPVRIALPARPDKVSPSGNGAEHPAVRIVLPALTPVAPVRLVPPKITPSVAPDSATKPGTAIRGLPAASEPRFADPSQSRPKNETARVSTLTPSPVPPAEAGPPVPVVVTASPLDGFDAIPVPFRWVLFGIASANFLIQIWIYVVS
jgi:hypothetical protein